MSAITQYETDEYDKNQDIIIPGRYVFKEIRLRSNLGVEVDLVNSVVGFVYYENLYTPFLTAELAVVDTENIPTTYNIQGGEEIIITIRDCRSNDRTFSFFITKISDYTPMSVGSMSYSIHMTSENVIWSLRNKISRSYIKTKPEKIVEDILINDLRFKSSSYFYYDSKNPICCMIPNWRGLFSINWLTSRNATDTYKHSPYRTFMTGEGEIYHVPMDLLHSDVANKTRGEIYVINNRSTTSGTEIELVGDSRMPKHLYTFLTFQIVKTSDLIENLRNGLFEIQTQTIDLFNRKTSMEYYDYVENFNNSVHLGKQPFGIDDHFKIDDTTKPRSHWRSIAYHPGLFSQDESTNDVFNFAASHVSKNQQIENLKVRGELPGSFELRVGQKYEINIPNYRRVSEETLNKPDERLSGKFILEAIRHEFSPDDQYVARCQFYRDALSQ